MVVTILACVSSVSIAWVVFLYWHFNTVEKETKKARDSGYTEGLTFGATEGVKIGYKKGVEETAAKYKQKVETTIKNLESYYAPASKPKPTKDVSKKTPDLHKLERPTHLKVVTEEEKTDL